MGIRICPKNVDNIIVCKGVPGPTKKSRSQHYIKFPPKIPRARSQHKTLANS